MPKKPNNLQPFDIESLIDKVFPLDVEFMPERLNPAMLPMFIAEVEDARIILNFTIYAPFRITSKLPQQFSLESEIMGLETAEYSGELTIDQLAEVQFLDCPRWSEFSLDERSRDLGYPLCDMMDGYSDREYWLCFNEFRRRAKVEILRLLPQPKLILRELESRFDFDYHQWISEWEVVKLERSRIPHK